MAWGSAGRDVPVSRRQDAVARCFAEDEPVALPGRLQRGRLDHRLGDEDQGRQLPAREIADALAGDDNDSVE